MIQKTMIRFPEGKHLALTLSYDDGVEQDEKLIEILDRHGIKATFNLNSGVYAPEGKIYEAGTLHRRLTKSASTELYSNTNHEVAVHTLTHPYLEKLGAGLAAYEVIKDRENLETQFGCIVRGMAYPYGTFSDEVVNTLKSCGIVYARTTVATRKFEIPTDWLRMPSTCHHNDPELMSLAKKFVNLSPSRGAKLFFLWGHSYEFEGNNNWNVIEEFAEYMGGRDEIWYATNIEIYEYVEAFKQLVFSADGSIVSNPTNTDLWFALKDTVCQISAGETMYL